MALFTKLFERDHSPHDIPGARWYKVHVISNGTNISIDFTKSDLPATQIGVDGVRNIRIGNPPKLFNVIDYVVDFRSMAGTSGTYSKLINLFAAADVYSVQLPAAARYSELDLYLYLKEV